MLSIVQLVGMVLCLTAAAKISHRAQSLGAIASRWHALVTCNSNDVGILENGGNAETRPPLTVNYSESDLESSDYMPLPTNAQLTSCMSSYHRRQAFGTHIIKILSIITKYLFYATITLFYSLIIHEIQIQLILWFYATSCTQQLMHH